MKIKIPVALPVKEVLLNDLASVNRKGLAEIKLSNQLIYGGNKSMIRRYL